MRFYSVDASLLKQSVLFIDDGWSDGRIFNYPRLFVRPTLDELPVSLLSSSVSSRVFQGSIRVLAAVLKRRQRFFNDFSISSRVTLLLPAVTAKFLASSNDSSRMSARTDDRIASAFFDITYVRSVRFKHGKNGVKKIYFFNFSSIFTMDIKLNRPTTSFRMLEIYF